MGNNLTPEERAQELSTAAEEGHVTKVKRLIQKGADPNRKITDGDRTSRTSLHRAAKTKNNVDVLTKLLGYIKDVDATDDEGNTALHLAAGYYNNEVFVRTLLQAKPNCTIQNSKGQTALHSAIEGGNDMKIIEMLVQADCDPNVADFEGNTALHLCAVRRGIEPMIPGILLRFGANPNLKNENGQTALHLASISGNKTVLLLLKFHAKVRVRDKEGNKASDLAATEEIKQILLWEEQQLEERTYRIEAIPSLESSPRRNNENNYNTMFDGYNGDTDNLKLCYGPRDSHHYWKSGGGDGLIHLPDDSHVVVPPQAVPHGTVIKLRISPSDQCVEGEEPLFDFDKYNIELDVQLDLPGSPYKSAPTNSTSPTISDPSPAFTGMCIEGCNRWKSTRELKTSYDGKVGIHLNLNRTKSKPFVYKAPLEQRLSKIEVNLDSKQQNNDSLPHITSFTESPLNESAESLSSLSEEEKDDVRSDNFSENDQDEPQTETATNNYEMSSESSLSDRERDFYQIEGVEDDERYYTHPIDPELATIHEETSLYSAPPDSGTYSDEEKELYRQQEAPHQSAFESGKRWNYDARHWSKFDKDGRGNETNGDDVTMDDLDDLGNFMEEREGSRNSLPEY